MARRNSHLLASIALVALAAGCGTSNPSRFYTLDSTATPGPLPITRVAILVGPVTIPAAVAQPQFVVQVAPNRVEVDEFNRWASPLSDGIARALAGDLSAQLGAPEVATAPMANFDPSYRVTVDVQRFESIRGQAAIIDAVWTVRRISDGQTRSGRTFAQENVQGDSFDALAAAHSQAISKLSSEIAASIRSEAASKS
jgi:uncharacterized lipoprotein YmbA